MDGLGLLHEVLTLGLVELDVLSLIELVEFLVAPAVLAGAAVAVGVGALTAGVDAQLVVGIGIDRPAGEVHIVVALGGAFGHRVDVRGLVLQVDADVLHPRFEELRCALLDRRVGVGEEAQLQLLTVFLADAAGSFLPAGVVEELLRLGHVESADDGVVGFECPVRVDGGNEARGRLRIVLHDLFAQGLGVDAGTDGLPDLLVPSASLPVPNSLPLASATPGLMEIPLKRRPLPSLSSTLSAFSSAVNWSGLSPVMKSTSPERIACTCASEFV